MGIKESFRDFGGKIKDQFREFTAAPVRAYQRIREENEQEMEQFIIKQFLDLYTFTHPKISKIVTQVYGNPDVVNIFFDEVFDETVEEISTKFVKNPHKRQEIKKESLLQAKNFWEEKLSQPHNSFREILFGKSCITQINNKLEEFSEPHDNR